MFPFLNQFKMKTATISLLSKGILLMVSVLFFASLFFPLWRIELEAPQYPEGLVLQLHANKIGGNVDIINGLNHYIGMKTLHKEDFFEFTILPYIFGFFGVFALATIFIAKRKAVLTLFFSFIVFGVLAAIDFYRWNYEYGHNLDPNAAIKVPGMAYQPPLLGYKQLLNFGAYSIPDTGGWMLIAVILLLLFVVLNETNFMGFFKNPNIRPALLLVISLSLFSCSNNKMVPIKLNVDTCSYCSMTISEGKYGSEIITDKGRVYKFDDMMCMIHYCNDNPNVKIGSYFVSDYSKENELIPVPSAFFLSGGAIKSPMRGGIIAFSSQKEAKEYSIKLKAATATWDFVLKN
jgi:copper chaperone NosL